jgi:hypothetical protein
MLPTPANHDLLLQRLDNHVRNVVSHFGNKVYAWDVVNEVIDESQPDCMRKSTWFNVTGKDFIDTAFRVAREVAPGAALFINDYNSTIPNKGLLFAPWPTFKARHIPVDGRGTRCTTTRVPARLEHTARRSTCHPGRDPARDRDGRQHLHGSNNTSIANYDDPGERPCARAGITATTSRPSATTRPAHPVTRCGARRRQHVADQPGCERAAALRRQLHPPPYDGVVNPDTLPKIRVVVLSSLT